jgi:8-oxo-dGTP diphosphatase
LNTCATAERPGFAAVHVVAAALIDTGGRLLLAQRPPGKHLAGAWEFPGGKLEAGETPLAALARELREELGVVVEQAVPLVRIPWRYDQRELLLDAWRVTRWRGEPQSLEGQALRWQRPTGVDPAQLAPADRPLLQALRLPTRYPITPANVPLAQRERWRERLAAAIGHGERLLQLRLPSWPRAAVRELAAELLPLANRHGTGLLLNGDIEGARTLGIGVHLKSSQWAALAERPLPWRQLIGASCHDAGQLARAVALGADFATLSPVVTTASHPDAAPLGWPAFHALAEAAALPVYALGGMDPSMLEEACAAGAQGVAGIGGFWPANL